MTAARPWPAFSMASSSRPVPQNSFSGVGGNVIEAVYLNNFDLIAGGNINLTSGVNTLVLDSVGPATQVHLRELPPAPTTTTTTAASATVSTVATTSGATGAVIKPLVIIEQLVELDDT